MNTKLPWTILVLIIASAMILSACAGTNVPPTTLPTPSPTTAPTTVAPAATTAPTLEPTPSPTATTVPAPVGECSLTDHGVILALVQDGDHWVFDPANPKVLDASGNLVDRPDLAGCNLIMQGQKDPSVEIGYLWVLRDVFTTHDYSLSHLEANGTFICSNCSGWAFPTTWNMETWNAPEGQGVVYMFVSELRVNMINNVSSPHNWPIIVNFTDGTSNTYAPSETAGIETNASCKGLTEPQRIRVTGIVGQDPPYVGSLGETECWSVAWVDNSSSPVVWQGAYDNLEFTQVEYWLMPAEFDEASTNNWATAHIPAP